MTDESQRRLPRTERQRRHEVDIEPHAHPGEPRRVALTDHETGWREPAPRSQPTRSSERAGASRDRY
jgi:hypothetical protein